eukprot:TRINITY_DN66647_c4_g2_i1.p1 TRINITY_DN66647_c4_g2~~TRINITY_DN66647_c4_g2_i1.p1  ORF type:complete len:898 (+),score=98.43 TRINITY_DN66647_c4_g2_i1:89-2782(+)
MDPTNMDDELLDDEEEYAGYSEDESGGFGGPMEDDEYEPSEQEILEYCEWLGMDPDTDKQLTWIAREALKAPLPENWKICYTEDREVYYFNVRTGESIWDHPMDAYYKALFRQEKTKLEKKRKKMRLYNDSFAILPLQDFFSDLSEEDDDYEVPEHLLDPIDFRIYTDPVVLPTSGRTVSRHTIINNKWRDPFSREYVENRRLIPNVDKRNEVMTWLHSATDKYFTSFVDGSSLAPLLKIIPYLIDQECEVSLNTQARILKFLTRLFVLPAEQAPPASGTRSAKDKKGKEKNLDKGDKTPRDSARSNQNDSNARAQDVVHSIGYREVIHLTEEEVTCLLGSLLTMSTASSMEALYTLLECVPSFRSATVLHGFSPEILNVLHLSEADLLMLSNGGHGPKKASNNHNEYHDTGSNGEDDSYADGPEHQPHPPSDPMLQPSSHRLRVPSSTPSNANTSNQTMNSGGGESSRNGSFDTSLMTVHEDAKLQLKWALLLMDYPNHLNILEKLEWHNALNIIILTMNSIPEVAQQRVTLVCRLLRGLKGWPHNLKYCNDGLVKWLVEVTLLDCNPWNQILLIFDLLMNGSSEGAVEAVKRQKTLIIQSLFAATAAESSQGIQYAAMLGALLVFLGCCTLADFQSNRLLEMSITHDLLPRLTRQQWKPKHFEQTLQHIINSIKVEPAAANMLVRMSTHPVGRPIRFLVRELSKKKRQLQDVKNRLEAIEKSEKELSTGTVNWTLLVLRKMERDLVHAGQNLTSDQEGSPQQLKIEQQLSGIRAQIKKANKKKQELIQHTEHAQNLQDVLQILLAVRVKNKRGPPPNQVVSGKGTSPSGEIQQTAPPAVGGPRARRPRGKDRVEGDESPVGVGMDALALGTTPAALAMMSARSGGVPSGLLPPIV